MRNKLAGMVLVSCMLSLTIHAQQKQPPAKQTSSKAKSSVPSAAKKPAAANKTLPTPPAPPPVVLTPAEIKKTNIITACRQLLLRPMANQSFFPSDHPSLNFCLDSLTYEPSADGSLTRLKLKNEKQHTVYRFDVIYDSVSGRVNDISLFSQKELSETEYDREHKKYKIALAFRFAYSYPSDSLTQILQYIPPYTVPQYAWELKKTTDTFAITQYQYDNRRIFAKALLNRKTMLVDSAFYTTYSSFTPFVPELYGTNYYHYSKGLLDDFMMYGERKESYFHYRKIYNSAGKIVQVRYTIKRRFGVSSLEHVWTDIVRNANGFAEQNVRCSFTTGAKDTMAVEPPSYETGIGEIFTYGNQSMVTRVTTITADRCITKKVTTDYVLNEDGFVMEYTNKTEIKDRCRR